MIIRRTIAILFLSSLVAVARAQQQPQWDSTYRPGNYASRVANFRSYPNSEKDIIFLGNSITHYAEWNELFPDKPVRNRGISGDITFGILERLDEVTQGKPAKVFILIGINDIARNIPDSIILGNYTKIIQQIKTESPYTKVYFNSLLPVNGSFGDRGHFGKDDHIAFVNNGLKKLCIEEKITLIDIHPHFLDEEKKLDKKFTYDGLHLNAEGYRQWAAILMPYIK